MVSIAYLNFTLSHFQPTLGVLKTISIAAAVSAGMMFANEFG